MIIDLFILCLYHYDCFLTYRCLFLTSSLDRLTLSYNIHFVDSLTLTLYSHNSLSDISDIMQDDRSLKWNQHPVISTVLWILGSAEGNGTGGIPQNDSTNTLSISANTSTTSATTSATYTASSSSTSSSSSSSAQSAKERIVWKDQRGGTINEYFSLPSPANPSPMSSSSISSTVTSQPPFSPAPSPTAGPGGRGHSGSVDSDVFDLRTLQNTINNMHHNIYNPDATPSDITSPSDAAHHAEALTLRPRALTGYETHHNEVIHADGHQIPRPGSADSTQSPNWGFYVPITPPQQDVFAHHPYPPYAR